METGNVRKYVKPSRTRIRPSLIIGKDSAMVKKASQAYSDMLLRCYSEKHKLYPRYGARGIYVDISKEDFFSWYFAEYPIFKSLHPQSSQSVNRLDHDKPYSLGNIEMIPHYDNGTDALKRHGNGSKWGTKMDEIQCLVVHTFPPSSANMLRDHFKVHYQTISHIKRGITRPSLLELVSHD